MKTILALLIAITLGASTSAQAADRFYIAGGFDHFSSGLNGGDINFGWQINRFYALEGGLTVGAAQVTDSYGDSAAAAIAEGTVDVYGFLPLGRASRVSLFATAGIASIGVAVRDSYGDQGSASGVGARGGAGVDWQFARRFDLRLTGRYQAVSVAGITAGDETGNLQLLWRF